MNYECKICGKEYPLLLSLSKHLTNKHKYEGGLKQYYVDYQNFKIPKCEFCGNDARYKKGLIFHKTCCDKECLTKLKKTIIITDESKLKISKKLIESHKNGNHPGWSFINKDINKRSYPEKWFIKNVLEKNGFYFKYIIKEKLPFGKYFLDFAIIDLKVDIEIDGSQHFRTIDAINHDKIRDEFVRSNGWTVYRISWIELINNSNEIINNFLKSLTENRIYNIDDVLNLIKRKNKKLIFGSRKKYFDNVRSNTYAKYEPIMRAIENSDVYFSKFGWVKKISILTGIKHGKVSMWMKRYMPDFYKEKCFKRKCAYGVIG